MFEVGKAYIVMFKDGVAGGRKYREENLVCTKVKGPVVSFVPFIKDIDGESDTPDNSLIVQVTYNTASSLFHKALEYTGPIKAPSPVSLWFAGGTNSGS